ncbi:MAG: hypothetical protein LC785_05940 [Acidobacteria bacterium]|nr:hypothetical protein [Acidobacteriota bacterium]MCA1641486.1 hypothetical protein [Acidobacteriota bacterium]
MGEATLRVKVKDFNFSLSAPLIHSESTVEAEKAVLKFALDEGVTLALRLTGRLVEEGTRFQPERGQMETEQLNECGVRAQFVGSSLIGMFSLASEVLFEVSELALDLKQEYDLPLSLISNLMRTRQATYGLMVVERATGEEFVLPPSLTEQDRTAIALAQLAVVKGSFTRRMRRFPFTVTAKKELSNIPQDGKPFRFESALQKGDMPVLGQPVPLGRWKVTIEQAAIEKPEELRRAMAQDDGRDVKMSLLSLTGEVHFDFPEAPRLPDSPWDAKIEELEGLEKQLRSYLASRYHAAAARSLAGFSDEEQAELTARPEMDMGEDLSDE